MRKRDYLSFTVKEYLLLGRADAINGYNKDVKRIIRSLSGLNYNDIVERVKNYLIGFEIGTIEVYLYDLRLTPKFDANECTLTFDKDILPDEDQKTSALKESYSLIKKYGRK